MDYSHDTRYSSRNAWYTTVCCSSLIPDEDDGPESLDGLLISETVIPGFEYADHDFLKTEEFVDYLDEEQQDELKWLLKPEEQARLEEVRRAQAIRN